MPKGVQLPHSALLACVSAALAVMGQNKLYPVTGTGDQQQDKRYFFKLTQHDIHLSYLPLAHIFERIVANVMVALGASIGFYQGDQLKLLDDAQALRPTIFLTVPRVCTRFYDKIIAKTSKRTISKWLFNYALESKRKALRERNEFTHWFWDFLVFNKIRGLLGGRVEKILSGSAPLSAEVMEFMRVVFACEVFEGYGQTETSAGSCVTEFGDWSVAGHVGTPLPCTEFKLVDIPEMGYTSKDTPYPRGEICIRGPSCFTGYFGDEEKTKEALDGQGWVHTGDVGSMG